MSSKLSHIFNQHDCLPDHILQQYADGKLDRADARIVEEHLSDCPDCSDAIEGLQLLSPEKTDEIVARLGKKIDAASAGKGNYRWLAIAASIAVLLTVTWFVYDSFDKNRQETIVQNLNPDSDANQTQIPSSVDSLSPQPDNKYKVLQESEEQDRESEKAAEIVSISDAEMSKHSRSSGSGGGDAKLKSPKATTFFEVVDDETEVDFSFDFKPALDQDSKDEESVVEFANVSDDKFVAEEAKEDLTVVASGKSSGEKKNKETNTESTTKDGTGFFRAGTEGKKSKSSNKDELKKSEAAPAGTNAQTAVMEKEADASKADSGSMFTPVLADDNREEDSGVTLGGSYDITLYSKGLEAYDRRDFQTAAGLFEQEIQKNSWNTASFLYAGISYLNLNKNLPALSCFNKVIQSGDPEFLEEATFYRAKALIAIDNPAEARKDLEKVINMNGKFKLQASILLQEIK